MTPADVQGRAALRRVQPADPAVARGLRLLRARRGRPVHRRRQHRMAQRAAAGEHVGRRHVGGVRARLQSHPRRRAPDPRHHRPSQVDGADVSLVTSGEGVPTSAIIFTEGPVMESGWLLPDLDEPTATSSGTAARAASCSCRRARRAALRRMPPRPMCPRCRSIDVRWEPTSGRGRIWSFIVPHPPLLPAFARGRAVQRDHRRARGGSDDPLRRQPRGERRRRDQRDRPGDDQIGEPVQVVFHQIDDVTLPRWVRR